LAQRLTYYPITEKQSKTSEQSQQAKGKNGRF
jgi:hypothetical protein